MGRPAGLAFHPQEQGVEEAPAAARPAGAGALPGSLADRHPRPRFAGHTGTLSRTSAQMVWAEGDGRKRRLAARGKPFLEQGLDPREAFSVFANALVDGVDTKT